MLKIYCCPECKGTEITWDRGLRKAICPKDKTLVSDYWFHTLRKGKKGDRPAPNFTGTVKISKGKTIWENIPDYVLEYNGKQIGALHHGLDFIFFIEIFDPHKDKGHGTRFVEMLEQEARELGKSEISAFPVTDDSFEHILRDKRKWILAKDENGDKKYSKKLD